MQVGLNYLSHLSAPHKTIRSRVREIRQLCHSDTNTTYSESIEKAYSLALERIQNTTYERL